MKWLRKIIHDVVLEQNNDLSREVTKIKLDIEAIVTYINRIKDVENRLLTLREDTDVHYRRLNIKIDDKEHLLREEFELNMSGLVKHIDKKLELLGNKKGIVTDLLKKIAQLEGDKDVHG